jgi:hypothetical protein
LSIHEFYGGAMMQTRLIALLIAGTALTGCCATGSGCNTPVPGAPIAWDGLGEAPTGNGEQGEENRPKRRTAHNREIILGPLIEAPPNETSVQTSVQTSTRSDATARHEEWTRLPTEDSEADAKLARRLKICRGC